MSKIRMKKVVLSKCIFLLAALILFPLGITHAQTGGGSTGLKISFIDTPSRLPICRASGKGAGEATFYPANCNANSHKESHSETFSGFFKNEEETRLFDAGKKLTGEYVIPGRLSKYGVINPDLNAKVFINQEDFSLTFQSRISERMALELRNPEKTVLRKFDRIKKEAQLLCQDLHDGRIPELTSYMWKGTNGGSASYNENSNGNYWEVSSTATSSEFSIPMHDSGSANPFVYRRLTYERQGFALRVTFEASVCHLCCRYLSNDTGDIPPPPPPNY